MNALQNTAKEYLLATHDVGDDDDDFYYDPTTQKLCECIHRPEFMDKMYADNYGKIRDKAIDQMTFSEVCTFLTMIFRRDRFDGGSVRAFTENGTMRKLLERCLETDTDEGSDTE